MTATRPDGARRLHRGLGVVREEAVERHPGRPGALADPRLSPQPRVRLIQAHQIERDPSPLELLLGGLVGFALLLLICIAIPLAAPA